MATYHFEIKSGRNASDHADYVARQGFHRKREDLVTYGHGNLPAWAGENPKTLWKAAEKFERKNGAVYREAIIALPAELTAEQNKALVDDLVLKLAPGKPFQFAIHAPKSSLEGEANANDVPQDQKDVQALVMYLHSRYWMNNYNSVLRNEVRKCGPIRHQGRFEAAIQRLVWDDAIWVGHEQQYARKGKLWIHMNPNVFSQIGRL